MQQNLFLQRITLPGSMHKMSKHGREKERKKGQKKIVEVTEKATLFGSYYLLLRLALLVMYSTWELIRYAYSNGIIYFLIDHFVKLPSCRIN